MRTERPAVKFSYTASLQFHRLTREQQRYVVALLPLLPGRIQSRKATLHDSSLDPPRYRYRNRRLDLLFYLDPALQIPVILDLRMKAGALPS